MTKADKIYKVKCTYDMSSKNITFGMMPIRYNFSFHIFRVFFNQKHDNFNNLNYNLMQFFCSILTAILKWFTLTRRQKLHHQEFVFWTHVAVKLKLFVLEIDSHSALKFQKTVSFLSILVSISMEHLLNDLFEILSTNKTNNKFLPWNSSTIWHLCTFMCCYG